MFNIFLKEKKEMKNENNDIGNQAKIKYLNSWVPNCYIRSKSTTKHERVFQ